MAFTDGNNTYKVSRGGQAASLDGLGGTDTLYFDRLSKTAFKITQDVTGAIHVDSVSGASATYHFTLQNFEKLSFSYGATIVVLADLFGGTGGSTNHAPTVASPIADQVATTSNAFSFTVPPGSFSDADAGDSLTYTATLKNGTALPAWLIFNPTTMTFSGIPVYDTGIIELTVKATDKSGFSVSDTFILATTSGNDTITGTAGKDKIKAGDGDDTVHGDTGDDTIDGGNGNDTLYGDAGIDKITGAAGGDTLDGGAGNDKLLGGAGNDTYYIDNNGNGKGDVVTEKANEGDDAVISTISYTLTANVEKLNLAGTADLNGTGNKSDNTITGNDDGNLLKGMAGADTLIGGLGNDTLNGGIGSDTLSGGDGSDIFLFDGKLSTLTAANVDTITDFFSGTDYIYLKKSIFKASVIGDITDSGLSNFDSTAGGTVRTAVDSFSKHFLYDTSTGSLYYDADGSGIKAAVQFATLMGVTNLEARDLHIV